MAWRVEFTRPAERELDRLERTDRRRILRFLKERVADSTDPRGVGEVLRGRELGGYWKYRVGDFRVICDIRDHEILVLVIRIGNRREIYR